MAKTRAQLLSYFLRARPESYARMAAKYQIDASPAQIKRFLTLARGSKRDQALTFFERAAGLRISTVHDPIADDARTIRRKRSPAGLKRAADALEVPLEIVQEIKRARSPKAGRAILERYRAAEIHEPARSITAPVMRRGRLEREGVWYYYQLQASAIPFLRPPVPPGGSVEVRISWGIASLDDAARLTPGGSPPGLPEGGAWRSRIIRAIALPGLLEAAAAMAYSPVDVEVRHFSWDSDVDS